MTSPPNSRVIPAELGPQYSGDSPFKAAMRRHQSWYRATVLQVPYGTGPKPTDTAHYGNMLTPEHGRMGMNFLTAEIFQSAQARLSQGNGTIEPFRLFNNMLTSQAMCFNLFAPLQRNAEVAKRFVSCLVPEHVKEVTQVRIEWNPEPKEEYLNDRTAFDALIEYTDETAKTYALGIETKLTEPFSQQIYDGEKYRRWMRTKESPWQTESESQVQRTQFNQLWRDHLLAVALKNHSDSTYEKVRLLLVRHAEDTECERTVSAYQALLKTEQDSFKDITIQELVSKWKPLIVEPYFSDWIQAFQLRYIDLHRSAR